MVGALDAGAGAEIVTWPMLLAGLGIGALASQLGSVTVSSVPDEQSGEVGRTPEHRDQPRRVDRHRPQRRGPHRCPDHFPHRGHPEQPRGAVRHQVQGADTELASGVPFLSDKDLQAALDKANVPKATADEIVKENANARIDALRSSLSVVALIALIALFTTMTIPRTQPTAAAPT